MKSEYFKLSDEEVEALGNEYRTFITHEKGWDDVSYLSSSVDPINSGFAKLLDNTEVLATFSLVRIQLNIQYCELCGIVVHLMSLGAQKW